jgi:hypothetical protein
MNKIDLIIDALEGVAVSACQPHKNVIEALAAARDLQALKPVGEFMIAADINGKNCYIQVEEKDTFTFSLYALNEETK